MIEHLSLFALVWLPILQTETECAVIYPLTNAGQVIPHKTSKSYQIIEYKSIFYLGSS